ncbi:MAG TPA: FAD:protein FMN transferase [Vicinamibacteria bacterium]|jgi:thiamine biosynthesis lipoprotein
MSMGSAFSIVAYGADAGALSEAVEAALDEVDRIDRLMSHYRPESPLSRLNREAAQGPVRVEPELFTFLAECLRYSRESEGAFDVTVGPLMKAWGFFRGEGRLPRDEEVAEVRARVGYRHVVLDAARGTVRFDRPGVELDLGGIGKGYAVDRAAAVLRARGVAAALVSAGGSTTYGLGAPPGERGWAVSVADPAHTSRTALTLVLRDRALSVSGSYEKSFEVGGVRYSHIMDPRSGRPVQGMLSVAVLAPTGTEGDALDNVLFVEGVARGRATVARHPGTSAYFFLEEAGGGWRMETAGEPPRATRTPGAGPAVSAPARP